MKTIVITGGTRGVGLGLAEEFLKLGCNVVICGRSQNSVDAALEKFRALHAAGRIVGQACDVADEAQVQALWNLAKSAFGRVDIWLNNAALNAEARPLWEVDAATMQTILNANVMGTINGCNVAIRGMIEQGGGHIYNVKGLGSGGETINGNAPYGLTKSTVTYITKALIKETKRLPIKISTTSPGIVTTDLLMKSLDPAHTRREMTFLNIIADDVATVSPWLARRILENERGGRHIEWMHPMKMMGRFLMAPFRRRVILPELQHSRS